MGVSNITKDILKPRWKAFETIYRNLHGCDAETQIVKLCLWTNKNM